MAVALRFCSWSLGQRALRERHLELLRGLRADALALQGLTADGFRAAADLGEVVSGANVAGTGGDGCALVLGPRVAVESAEVLAGSVAPEHALVVAATIGEVAMRFGSFLVPPGIGRFARAGKEKTVRAVARWMGGVVERGVAGMDANSPKVDARDLARSEWWSEPERELLGVDRAHAWRDVYREVVERDPALLARIPARGPLAESFRRGPGDPCRYDHVHATPDVRVVAVEYRRVPELADHALVVADLEA
jgi:hypothetical protein